MTPGMPSWAFAHLHPAKNLATLPQRCLGLQLEPLWAAVTWGTPSAIRHPLLRGFRAPARARNLLLRRQTILRRRPPPPHHHHLLETLTVGRTEGLTNRAPSKRRTPATLPVPFLPHLAAVIRQQAVEGDGAGRGTTRCCTPPPCRCVTSPSASEAWRTLVVTQHPLAVAAVPDLAVRQSWERRDGSGRRRNNKTQGRATLMLLKIVFLSLTNISGT